MSDYRHGEMDGDRFIPIIHAILEADKQAHPKQRHTGKRIFDRLCKEHGYRGKVTVVQDEIRRSKQASSEVFVPLSHPPGEAQVDFGEAKAVYRGRQIKVMSCVTSLPFSDAFFCQAFPRECTETCQAGHQRAFEFFGAVPRRISYDNSKIAVAKVVGRRGKTPTRELLRVQAHYLYDHHFCLVRLCEQELLDREQRAAQRRLKAAQFPNHKTLEDFRFEAQPTINRLLASELMRGQYIEKRESVILIGHPGTGKTHLATALGIAACGQGKKVRFHRVTELITPLMEAREERQLMRMKNQLARLDLLILDELGYGVRRQLVVCFSDNYVFA